VSAYDTIILGFGKSLSDLLINIDALFFMLLSIETLFNSKTFSLHSSPQIPKQRDGDAGCPYVTIPTRLVFSYNPKAYDTEGIRFA
jgi:hypothetical protein